MFVRLAFWAVNHPRHCRHKASSGTANCQTLCWRKHTAFMSFRMLSSDSSAFHIVPIILEKWASPKNRLEASEPEQNCTHPQSPQPHTATNMSCIPVPSSIQITSKNKTCALHSLLPFQNRNWDDDFWVPQNTCARTCTYLIFPCSNLCTWAVSNKSWDVWDIFALGLLPNWNKVLRHQVPGAVTCSGSHRSIPKPDKNTYQSSRGKENPATGQHVNGTFDCLASAWVQVIYKCFTMSTKLPCFGSLSSLSGMVKSGCQKSITRTKRSCAAKKSKEKESVWEILRHDMKSAWCARCSCCALAESSSESFLVECMKDVSSDSMFPHVDEVPTAASRQISRDKHS